MFSCRYKSMWVRYVYILRENGIEMFYGHPYSSRIMVRPEAEPTVQLITIKNEKSLAAWRKLQEVRS